METKYDKEIDAKYVSIKRGKVAHTTRDKEWLLFDYDKNGDVLGIEILDASKHLISIYTAKEGFLGFGVEESARGSDDESLGLTIKSPSYKKEHQFVQA